MFSYFKRRRTTRRINNLLRNIAKNRMYLLVLEKSGYDNPFVAGEMARDEEELRQLSYKENNLQGDSP